LAPINRKTRKKTTESEASSVAKSEAKSPVKRRQRSRRSATDADESSNATRVAARKPRSRTSNAASSRGSTPAPDGDQAASRSEGRRFYEIFGILTLSSAVLIGLSLITVQFGSGKMMGPFGLMVGSLIHGALGLGAHLVVLALVVIAFRIFSGALGRSRHSTLSLIAAWRQRIGLLFALAFGTVFLHMLGRPDRLAGASLGGAIGEYGAELSCALISDTGTWIITITGLALAMVLSTDFSWARAWVSLWAATGRGVDNAGGAVERFRGRMQLMGSWIGQQMALPARRATITDQGAAALPPIVRIDLSDHVEQPPPREESLTPDFDPSLPSDLEIGKNGEPETLERLQPEPRAKDAAKDTRATAADTDEEPGRKRRPKRRRTPATLDGDQLAAALGTFEGDTTAAPNAEQPTSAEEPTNAEERTSDEHAIEQSAAKAAQLDEVSVVEAPRRTAPAEIEASDTEASPAVSSTLTIVQPSFEKEEDAQDDLEEKPLDDPKGEGFVLKTAVIVRRPCRFWRFIKRAKPASTKRRFKGRPCG
jgi:hypothetical protein